MGEDDLMFVETILPAARKRLATINDDAPLIDAAKLLVDLHTDLVIVCRFDGLLAGVITKTDIVRQISQCQEPGCTAKIVMTQTVILCHPGDLMRDVWSTMHKRGLKNIPIVGQDSRPLGVLNARDALEALLKEAESEEALLREYVMGVGYN